MSVTHVLAVVCLVMRAFKMHAESILATAAAALCVPTTPDLFIVTPEGSASDTGLHFFPRPTPASGDLQSLLKREI